MTRLTRTLLSLNASSSSAVAEPPQAVAVESDFVVVLAALLCALICVVGVIAMARCTWLRRGAAQNGRLSVSISSANKGLKKKILQSLPRYTYDADAKGKIASECAICLGEYADGEAIRILPQCGHGFHVGCIDMWLASHSSCPSCRQILAVARCRKCGELPDLPRASVPMPA